MSAAKIEALVLDFGGVISRTMFETQPESELALGLPAGTLTWQGPFGNDVLWARMQRDEISERDYWLTRSREVGKLLGEDWVDMQTLVQRARGNDVDAVIRPEAVETILAAKAAGLKLAILSNELDLFYGVDLRKRLKLLAHFDVIVDATYTGILKPDPRSYGAVCTALVLPPSACLFVDDQIKNIIGAQTFGMQTVWFDVKEPKTAYQQVTQQLNRNVTHIPINTF